MSKRLLLILNPVSGKMMGKKYLSDVIEKFCRAGYAPLVFTTNESGHATRLAMEYGNQVDLVVCMGGDGTFNEVASGLLIAGHKTQMGYIPCGSTNDFANSIGLEKTVPAAADAILNGTPHTYDMGVFDQRYFSYVASFGAFTRTSYSTPQDIKNALGHLAYVLEGGKEIFNIRPWHARIEVDGEIVEEGDYLFGAISNCLTVGGGLLKLDPTTVSLNDGYLELLLVKNPRNPVELNDCVAALVEQRYDSECIRFCKGKSFVLETDAGMDWTLDGEWCAGAEKIRVCTLADAVTLIH